MTSQGRSILQSAGRDRGDMISNKSKGPQYGFSTSASKNSDLRSKPPLKGIQRNRKKDDRAALARGWQEEANLSS